MLNLSNFKDKVASVDPKQLVFVCNMRSPGQGKSYDKIADSLNKDGILYPPTVTANGEIVDGHCRLDWAVDNGINPVQVLVRDIPKGDIPLHQFRSFDRKDAGSNGVTLALQNYVELNNDKTNQEIADLFGVSTATVSFALSIERKLPELKPLIKAGKITPSTAKSIAADLPEIGERSWDQTAAIDAIKEFAEASETPVSKRHINTHLAKIEKPLIPTKNANSQPKAEKTKKPSASALLNSILEYMTVDSEDDQTVVFSTQVPRNIFQILQQMKLGNSQEQKTESVQLAEVAYLVADKDVVDYNNIADVNRFFLNIRNLDDTSAHIIVYRETGTITIDADTFFDLDSSVKSSFEKTNGYSLFCACPEDPDGFIDMIRKAVTDKLTVHMVEGTNDNPEPTQPIEEQIVVTETVESEAPELLAEITDDELAALLAEDLTESEPDGLDPTLINRLVEAAIEDELADEEETEAS